MRQDLTVKVFQINECVCVYTQAETSAGEGGGSGPALPNPRMYDKVYFDSDSDEDDTPSKYD